MAREISTLTGRVPARRALVALVMFAALAVVMAASGVAPRSAEATHGLSLQRADYPVGDPAVADRVDSLALADMDGDGDRDVITANSNSDTVSVLPNDGEGAFGSSTQTETTCDFPHNLLVGNLDPNNAGATPDALVSCFDSQRKGVTLLGDGAGGFAAPIGANCCFVSTGGLDWSRTVALGHMNTATGGLDVAFRSGTNQSFENLLAHAIGNGNGTFASPTFAIDPDTRAYTPIQRIGEVALADLDDDGLNGVIAFSKLGDKVLFFNDYDLANHPFTGFSPVPSERAIESTEGRTLDPGDIDGDGDTDLVVGHNDFEDNQNSNKLSVFIWGENGFDPVDPPDVYATVLPQDTDLGDINGDGDTDILVAGNARTVSEPPNLLAVHLGKGDGTFEEAVVFPLPGSGVYEGRKSSIKIADLDGDGVDDAAVASSLSDVVSVFLGVSSQNQPPTATNDEYSTTEGETLTIPDGSTDILFNDTDANGDTLTVATPRPISGPANGALTLNGNGSFTYTPNSGFTGPDSFTYKATDGKAESNVATAAITVEAADGDPPNTTITSGPPPLTKSKSATFQFTSSETNSTFECKRDGEAFSPCTSPKSYANLPSGPHAFQVRAKDAAGNTDPTPARRNWIVDAVKPTTTALQPAPGSSTRSRTVGIRATVQDNRTNLAKSDIQLFVDGTKRTSFTYNPATDRLSFTARNLPLGKHTVRIKAIDAAGNAAIRVWSFRVIRR